MKSVNFWARIKSVNHSKESEAMMIKTVTRTYGYTEIVACTQCAGSHVPFT